MRRLSVPGRGDSIYKVAVATEGVREYAMSLERCIGAKFFIVKKY